MCIQFKCKRFNWNSPRKKRTAILIMSCIHCVHTFTSYEVQVNCFAYTKEVSRNEFEKIGAEEKNVRISFFQDNKEIAVVADEDLWEDKVENEEVRVAYGKYSYLAKILKKSGKYMSFLIAHI